MSACCFTVSLKSSAGMDGMTLMSLERQERQTLLPLGL